MPKVKGPVEMNRGADAQMQSASEENHRIKVLFVELKLALGGMERVLQNLVTTLDRSQVEPIVAVLGEEGAVAGELRSTGVKMFSRLISRNYDPRGVRALASIARREGADIVYCVNSPMAMVYSWLTLLLSPTKHFIVAFHNMGHFRRRWWRRLVLRLTRPSVSAYVAVSNGQREFFSKNQGVPARRIQVIYVGVDTDRFSVQGYDRSARQELGIPDDALVVGIVAVLRPEKRHDLFLRMAQLVSRSRNDVYYVLVGDGQERGRLEELAEELGVTQYVRFAGARSDVPRMLRAFDLFVLCSGRGVETFPQCMVEAMAMELPVVSTDVGSIQEIVDNGVTGCLVAEGDLESLADRVQRLLDNADERVKMGQAGRRRVDELFSREVMVERFTELFHRVAADDTAHL